MRRLPRCVELPFHHFCEAQNHTRDEVLIPDVKQTNKQTNKQIMRDITACSQYVAVCCNYGQMILVSQWHTRTDVKS
jgi:hypothetical protein